MILSKKPLREVNHDLHDIVEIEDERTKKGESYFCELEPLRYFRGNYGVPRIRGNQVVKGYFYAEINELNLLENLHDDYIKELNRYIPVIETQTIREGNLMYLLQPYLKGVTYENMLQSDFSLEQKSQAFQEILTQALRVVTQSDKLIGIDGKPENWIYEGDRWVLLDTFPPFMVDDDNTFAQIFDLRKFEKDFARNPDKTYFRDPSKIIRRLWLKSQKFDPELDYKGFALDVVQKMELSDSLYRKVRMLK